MNAFFLFRLESSLIHIKNPSFFSPLFASGKFLFPYHDINIFLPLVLVGILLLSYCTVCLITIDPLGQWPVEAATQRLNV